jgi:S-(hydroxymethyl)glutathione dehydrogenase/alcohol dehydrogenase
MGPAFGGARGRTGVPEIVDWYMDRKINTDSLIAPRNSGASRVRSAVLY